MLIDHCISAAERNIMSLCTFHSNCCGRHGGREMGGKAMQLTAGAVAAAMTVVVAVAVTVARPQHSSSVMWIS